MGWKGSLSYEVGKCEIDKMGILECECKDVYESSDSSKTRYEKKGGTKSGVFERNQRIMGRCSCVIDGKAKSFDGISLSAESQRLPLLRGKSITPMTMRVLSRY